MRVIKGVGKHNVGIDFANAFVSGDDRSPGYIGMGYIVSVNRRFCDPVYPNRVVLRHISPGRSMVGNKSNNWLTGMI